LCMRAAISIDVCDPVDRPPGVGVDGDMRIISDFTKSAVESVVGVEASSALTRSRCRAIVPSDRLLCNEGNIALETTAGTSFTAFDFA
jgi:hypothetical protein